MTRGKPWDINEIRRLHQLVEEGKSVDEICRIMVKTRDAVIQKMFDLKLKSVKEKKIRVSGKKTIFSSSQLVIPEDLPTVEDTLKILAASLLKSTEAGLCRDEVFRLQATANLAKNYKDAFAEYLDYRGIEERMDRLEDKFEGLEQKGKALSAK